ncbi:hypothetical protein [Botrimarina sp.]|uniref:hypothetical protein n=1 Tax=Botrimarina sp. TaxID=2795802 RepID=UPI0032EFF3AD
MQYSPISPRQASSLADQTWTIGQTTYQFASQLRSGGEAFLYPLLDTNKKIVAYLRFLQKQFASPGRIERTCWLIDQKWPAVSSVFLGAPYAWASTELHGRPPGFGLDFTATLHQSVPGLSWAAIKTAADRGKQPLPRMETRIALVKSMVAQFATLESLGIVHGDPSDGNLLLDIRTREAKLIDFDAFVVRSNNLRFPALPVSEGGVKGTPGYMPPDLEATSGSSVAPYSDRFGRDMLMLELLGMRPGDPADASPSSWSHQQLLLDAVRPTAEKLGLMHLADLSVFTSSEKDRPTSKDLAIALSCQMPAVTKRPPANPANTISHVANDLSGLLGRFHAWWRSINEFCDKIETKVRRWFR